jgi:putative flippase GtrA
MGGPKKLVTQFLKFGVVGVIATGIVMLWNFSPVSTGLTRRRAN